jgi:hypothetical protein
VIHAPPTLFSALIGSVVLRRVLGAAIPLPLQVGGTLYPGHFAYYTSAGSRRTLPLRYRLGSASQPGLLAEHTSVLGERARLQLVAMVGLDAEMMDVPTRRHPPGPVELNRQRAGTQERNREHSRERIPPPPRPPSPRPAKPGAPRRPPSYEERQRRLQTVTAR